MLRRYLLIVLAIGLVHAHQPNPEIGLSAEMKQKFLDVHNDARRKQGSSNMYELEWDDHLAIIAWRWAQHCNFTHGQINNDYGGDIGQNLYVTEGETNKFGGIYSWIAESVYYVYDTGECKKQPCGHYTMATWASSNKMGCAYAACPRLYWPEHDKYLQDAHNIVCHYWPAGNIVGMKPFKKGPACSECNDGHGWCKDGLCQAFCEEKGPGCECSNNLKCENCGTTDPDKCSCKCSKGFQGTWCNEVCRNKDARCQSFQSAHCANPKYGKTIKELCPIVCGTCEYQEDRNWTCQGKTWETVFGVVDVNPSSDDRGCTYPFIYQGQYSDQCVDDPRRGRICSTSFNLDLYRTYKPCPLTMTFGGNAGGEPCHFPFIYQGKKHYTCLRRGRSHRYWCGTTRHYDRDGRFGMCIQNEEEVVEE